MISKQKLAEIIGWYGTFAIVGAYAFVSFGVISANGSAYQMLNLSGAIGLIVISLRKKVRQTVVLNLFWAAIALVSLFRVTF